MMLKKICHLSTRKHPHIPHTKGKMGENFKIWGGRGGGKGGRRKD